MFADCACVCPGLYICIQTYIFYIYIYIHICIDLCAGFPTALLSPLPGGVGVQQRDPGGPGLDWEADPTVPEPERGEAVPRPPAAAASGRGGPQGALGGGEGRVQGEVFISDLG